MLTRFGFRFCTTKAVIFFIKRTQPSAIRSGLGCRRSRLSGVKRLALLSRPKSREKPARKQIKPRDYIVKSRSTQGLERRSQIVIQIEPALTSKRYSQNRGRFLLVYPEVSDSQAAL